MYEDKTLVCKECGKEFVFTAGEQEFYAERGFQNEPQRCKAVPPVSSTPRPAPAAAARPRCPSSPRPTAPCTAASASLRCAPTAKPEKLHEDNGAEVSAPLFFAEMRYNI